MSEFSVAAETRTMLGEGPLWVERLGRLFWVDILGQRLHAFDVADGSVTDWAMPEPICWLVERVGRADFLAGFASGFAALTLEPLEIGAVTPLGPLQEGHRLNDAKVDPAGRLWAGKMQGQGATPTGGLYRTRGGGAPMCADDGYLVPNGPAFSPDGAYMYHADSPRGIVYRFALAPDGSLGDRREHIRFAEGWGVPDGMTVDAEGHLWVAHWDGGRVSRFDPDGGLDRAIGLPASRITSCAFGGAGLDRLFVTSARIDRADEPLAGALFEVDARVRGVAPVAFAG